MTEAELQRHVYELLYAREPQLIWHHCRRADACDGDPGFPDLLIVGDGRMIFRELKGSETRTSIAQLGFGDELALAGADWGIWRPDDLESGRIEKELDGLR